MASKKSRSKNRKKESRKNLYIVLGAVLGGTLLLLAFFILDPRQKTVDPNYVPEFVGGPSLKADKEQIDFGDVKINKYVTAAFELTNVGDETLRFEGEPFVELKAGC